MRNKQIKNLFYTKKRIESNAGCNILYNQNETFFDAIVNEISSNILISWPIERNQSIQFIESIFYSAVWINDPIDFSQHMQEYANLFSKYIMCIHAPPSQLFKKEDINIIKNKLNSQSFLSFYPDKSCWPMNKIKWLNYGIPNTNNIKQDKKKDILVINTKKQKQAYILYQYLKNDFPQTEMLESCSMVFEDITKILSQYKICIDLDSYFNAVLANACGAYGLTFLDTFDDAIYSTKNYGQIFEIIPSLLQKNTDTYANISDQALKKYDWNTFENNIKEHFNSVLLEDFPI